MSAQTLAARARQILPAGGSLPDADWQRRHRALVILLWALVVALPLYSLLTTHYGFGHNLLHAAVLAPFAALACVPRLGRKLRSVLVSVGLLTAAALMVHISGGVIEAHFAFFVLVVLLTLYEDWLVFGVAVAFVLLHHGLMGMFDPHGVFNRPEQWADPWKWAGIHAIFVAGAGIAGVVAWRLNEDVRARMRESQRLLEVAAETDSLTGLANRRRLMSDLPIALAEASDDRPLSLTILDLNGFKAYNDSFGHMAGDTLLARLGSRLERDVPPGVRVYRLGGDEFCVLASNLADPTPVEQQAAAALHEHGEGFQVDAAWGSVLVPRDGTTAEATLRTADQRMYAQKNGGRPPASDQSKSVLLRAIAERDPTLGHHLDGVGAMAENVGARLGLDGNELDRVRHAAELHDVGKVAIPDAIINKPGRLDDAEMAFIQRHTIIGERIIGAAPALAHVARLVRSSHERYDGTGYPDQLVGEKIPLGARIVAVCDAFDAMVTDRPYRAARSEDEALAELSRCAGTQFDPSVVAAFLEVARDRHAVVAA